ncbi:Fmp40p SCDLUD_001131 [Saccharomycodes ludwigii]|uniref:Fmp40p n=1 Tax=Saccharomycodes ludwigii TaxID=36035 RepID=UPI001E825B0E|nr:hypothetical protein SCDLUD_001131 [Saccharomycodes ludwigii]KAH3903491.1 hypothetical protein SCDLUD_001131 [Saccharomycodes ludwigii]
MSNNTPQLLLLKDILKDSASSKFTSFTAVNRNKLKPDLLIPTATKAIDIYENEDDEKTWKKVFHTPRMVSKDAQYAFTVPERRLHYKSILSSPKSFQKFGIDPKNKENLDFLNGTRLFYDKDNGIFPYSMAYAGFQFGTFAGQLGDGRVVNLFDLPCTVDGTRYTFQIKGAGLTPFSRFADGKAVLRSSIREFIISEALHHIGMPSTRAIQLTLLPGTRAKREFFEPCAQVTRYSQSWIRMGNFDLLRWRNDIEGLINLSDYVINNDLEKTHDRFPSSGLPPLQLFTKDYFPDINDGKENDDDTSVMDFKINKLTKYDNMFRKISFLNAQCVAYWQAYGFLNGVLNTDNTSIIGLSMDFGPFSFMDKFDPRYTPNHDDVQLRYSYANQPGAVWWNLTKLGDSLSPLLGCGPKYIKDLLEKKSLFFDDHHAEKEEYIVKRAGNMISVIQNEYKFWFTIFFTKIFCQRIGINLFDNISGDINKLNINEIVAEVKNLQSNVIQPLLEFLYTSQLDYNFFFLNFQSFTSNDFFKLNDDTNNGTNINPKLTKLLFKKSDSNSVEYTHKFEKLQKFLKGYAEYITAKNISLKSRIEVSSKVNPLFIPRNFIFDQVVNDFYDRQRKELHNPNAQLDTSLLEKLYLMSVNPYDSNKWENSTLHPEVVNDWTENVQLMDPAELMKQCGCSS